MKPKNTRVEVDLKTFEAAYRSFPTVRRSVAGAALVCASVLTGCGEGARPILVEGDTLVVSGKDLAAELSPAPAGTTELAVPAELTFQATVEDALDHWAGLSNTAFRGDCSTPLFDQGEADTDSDTSVGSDTSVVLCSSGTARPLVVHLGPDTSTVWHVVTLTETADGVKVSAVSRAGG